MIRKFCGRCNEEVEGNDGFYFQIFQRANRENRDNFFLCEDCLLELDEFMNDSAHKKEDKQ